MDTDLLDLLEPFLSACDSPGQGDYQAVSWEGLRYLAHSREISLNQAMILCLHQDIWPQSLRKNRGTYSAIDQAGLLASRAALIGAGGLGGMVLLLLVRMGVGKITICDGDVFDQSNLNRQFLAKPGLVGSPKVKAAAQEAGEINPALEVRALARWADEKSLPAILEGAQVAVDCLDNLTARFALERAAAQAGIPYVHGGIAGQEGFVMTVLPGEPGLKGLYGGEEAASGGGAEKLMGAPTITPALLAGFQANEAVNLLLGRRGLAAGQVMHLDISGPSLEMFQLA